jgi:hypothetical protein
MISGCMCNRLLPLNLPVRRADVLRILPEEQLQELPNTLHPGPVLPKLLLPVARCMIMNRMLPQPNAYRSL